VLRADTSEDEDDGSASRSSSLQRRGAVRSKKNPVSARKSDDEDEGDGSDSNSSSLRRCGAVKHKQNPVAIRTTQGGFKLLSRSFQGSLVDGRGFGRE
jgi:hypothetical protein